MEKVRRYVVTEAQLAEFERAVQELPDLHRVMVNTILIYVRAPTFARRAELREAADEAIPLLEARANTFQNALAQLRAHEITEDHLDQP